MNRVVFIHQNDLVDGGADKVWVVTTRDFGTERDVVVWESASFMPMIFGRLGVDACEVQTTWVSSYNDDVFDADARAYRKTTGEYEWADHMMVS